MPVACDPAMLSVSRNVPLVRVSVWAKRVASIT